MFRTPSDSEPPLRTCWSNKSPLLVATILVFIIALFFLIIFIVVYILMLTVWNQSAECSTLCDVFIRWKYTRKFTDLTDYPLYEPMSDILQDSIFDCNLDSCNSSEFGVPDNISNKDIETYHQVLSLLQNPTETTLPQNYTSNSTTSTASSTSTASTTPAPPAFRRLEVEEEDPDFLPIGALLQKLYVDDDEVDEDIFKCHVVVLSPNWILTTADCLDENDFSSFFIRLDSYYWSESGDLRRIDKAFLYRDLIACKLSPGEGGGQRKEKIKIKLLEDDKVQTLFWKIGNLTAPLEKRTRTEELETIVLEVEEISTKSRFWSSSQPLLDEDQNLVGFMGLGIFSQKDVKDYSMWLQNIGVFA